MHGVREDDVEIAIAQIGARVADLARVPAVLEAVQQFSRRADVEAYARGRAGRAEGAHEGEHF